MKSGRNILFSAKIYVASISPVAVMVVVAIYMMSRMYGMPGSPGEAVGWGLGFLSAATLGHVLVILLGGESRSKAFSERRWTMPLCCGLVLSGFTLGGLVVKSSDIVGLHKHEEMMMAVLVFLWSILASVIVVCLDRFLNWVRRGQVT